VILVYLAMLYTLFHHILLITKKNKWLTNWLIVQEDKNYTVREIITLLIMVLDFDEFSAIKFVHFFLTIVF
ncbi:hypothetical protein, partial [Mesobacillus zeae]